MDGIHSISDDIVALIQNEYDNGSRSLAYNTKSYFIEREDLAFFKKEDEAYHYCMSNISDYDSYHAIPMNSVKAAVREIVSGQPFEDNTQKVYDSIALSDENSTFKNINNMNQKNFDYLKDQVKFTGFGESLEPILKENIEKQSSEFKIFHNAKFGNDLAVATLHFKKSDLSDMYFFNKYNLAVKPENSQDMIEQTFYINKSNNITLKEAYNLMAGRSVNKDLTNKEGQLYNAWLQMDFKQVDKNGNYELKQYHKNYGFDLDKELAKHPIKELSNDQEKIKLEDSLLRGNRQAVTFLQEGKEQRMFIEANPRFKSVNVYDSSMQRVNTPEQSIKQEAKKEGQKQPDDNEEGVAKASKKIVRSKKQSIS